MKISKRHLRRIIKEEKARLQLRGRIRSLIREQATDLSGANPDDVVAKVIVYDETYDYTRSDIAEMLNDKNTYVNADNLPKWLRTTGFMDTYPEVWRYLEALVNYQGPAVTITVRSDRPLEPSIAIPRLPGE